VAVSVDAGKKETYESIRQGGKWEVLVENISKLVKERQARGLNRPLITTNFVVMKDNFEELPMYVREMASLHVDVVAVVNAHNVYSSDRNQGIFDLPGKPNEVAEKREEMIRKVLSIRLPRGTSILLPAFKPRKQLPECSLDAASSILVGIEGEVYPCCVIESLDYEGVAEAKSMGNVFRDELENIWNSKQFVDFRAKMLTGQAPSPICLNCPFFYDM
jgi:radical SAM protein with 4Fe4S-binding SPASM domain